MITSEKRNLKTKAKMKKSAWVKITSKNAPTHKVLVTNNLNATGSSGIMSHVWIAEVGVTERSKGRYDAAIDILNFEYAHDVTHFCEIPTP